MGNRECIVDVEVGEFGQRRREGLIVTRVRRLEADVLQHQHHARRELPGQFDHVGSDHRGSERDRGPGQL